ncbi:MAG TPA: hypothetical protein VHL30_03170, partial [Chlamydiales bacterium]|nr:hypothetical protein [Chlamydiales bacterium]
MKSAKRLWCFCFAVFFQSFLFAGSYTVTSPADSGAGTLPTIMDQIRINSDPDPTIHFSPHFALSPANWTIDSKGYAIALPSVISGSGGLVKSDSSSLNGTLTLTGKNTYLGGTTITGGT